MTREAKGDGSAVFQDVPLSKYLLRNVDARKLRPGRTSNDSRKRVFGVRIVDGDDCFCVLARKGGQN